MKSSSIIVVLLVGLLLGSQAAHAQQKNTEHTYSLKGAKSPAATFDDVSWLIGDWVGDAFGSHMEEVWNPPSADSMVGMFKVYDDKKGVSFYELMLITKHEGSLALKVKHFTKDFIAWESKEDFVTFPLVKIEADAIHFSGLSFYRDGENKINGYIALKQDDGSKTEHLLAYRRRGAN